MLDLPSAANQITIKMKGQSQRISSFEVKCLVCTRYILGIGLVKRSRKRVCVSVPPERH